MAKTYRDYSVQDKAAALAWLEANDGNLLRASKDLKIPYSTLQSWRDGNAVSEEVTEVCEQKKKELGDLFEECCRLYMERAMDAGAIADTKGKDAVIAAATAFDKKQLAHGKPTTITGDAVTIAKAHLDALKEEFGGKLSEETLIAIAAADTGASKEELVH